MELRPQNFPGQIVEGRNFDDPINLPEHLCIGKEMHNFIYELQRHGSHLLKLLSESPIDSNVQDLLSKYIAQYSKQSCKIAIVGQMKAGKSAFINALIGRRSLLPSDINPWTSVITRLHFGIPGRPVDGAEFTFFDPEEWDALAHGGGKLRELVERFLPGFTSNELTQKLAEMRARTESRFGSHLTEILGKSHCYSNIAPHIIEQYVCAGHPWADEEDEQKAGHFSDVTKSADLFFKSSPFLYPTTIIDTPGTNDPFFVRDDITYRNLDEADIFVVVLPAQQAFSMSDLALLRILQGLRKDRIIIYINRIDQLDNPRSDTREVISHVQYMLKKEFPSVSFPIVAGSAHWGQQALEGNYTEEELLKGQWKDMFQKDDLLENERIRSKLYFYSGIPEVASVISKLMLKGKGRNSVGKIASNLHLTSDSVLAVLKNQLHSKQSVTGASQGQAAVPETEIHAISNKLDFLQEYATKCNYYHIQYEKNLSNLKDIVLESLRGTLNRVVEEFATHEVNQLLSELKKGGGSRVWRCDTLTIRRCLENEFLLVSKDVVVKINAVQEAAAAELRQYLNNAVPDVDDGFINVRALSESEPYLSAMVLKHTVALDLDHSWWKIWSSRQRKADEWSKELDQLVKTEFFPMVNRLVESARIEIDRLIDDSNRNFSAMSKSVANILMERTYELQEQSDKLLQKERQHEGGGGQTVREEQSSGKSMELIKRTENITHQLQQLLVKYDLLCRGRTVLAENVR